MKDILAIGILKTLFFNFRYLPFPQAVRLPFILARNVNIRRCKRGFCKFDNCPPHMGLVTIGFNRDANNSAPSSICIEGQVIIKGNKKHAFGAGCRIIVKSNAILEVGDDFGCTGDTCIIAFKKISIGAHNLWSYGCVVRDNDGHSIIGLDGKIINHPRDVIFGNNIWMGCNCLILKGAKISSDTIIAAGSRIGKNVGEPNSIISTDGVVLKRDIKWVH